ncbi:Uncharacterised protein [Vibrio cholerae]|uniref:Uncharacterized protein n=1 Tax=Vibrio cholerae TaxID=666 RepID=A0A656ABJ8_VIBCL|nr:Uncharacterised protein [Vibrio cholerae]
MPHSRLHVARNLTKTLRNKANRKGHHWCDDNQYQRELPAIPKHQGEQANNARPFTHNTD